VIFEEEDFVLETERGEVKEMRIEIKNGGKKSMGKG